MVSVTEADELIKNNIFVSTSKIINFKNSSGFVLGQNIQADRDYPSFNRVAMDGIAINFKSFTDGNQKFKIEGVTRAGQEQVQLKSPSHCLEVMTGGVLPLGCDVVIKYEDLDIAEGTACLHPNLKIAQMQNVQPKSIDYKKNDLVLTKNQSIGSTEMAVLASVGAYDVSVNKKPKIGIVSTGDELVDVNSIPLEHQIRRSNVYAIYSALNLNGFSDITMLHVKDNKNVIFDKLNTLLNEVDVLILSGGVSKGKFDFIPEVLADLKVNKVFHKITQKPGKPLWFGTREDNKIVFGLPGNPTSALTCLRRYVLPALWYSQNSNSVVQKYAKLSHDITFKKSMTYFVPVKVEFSNQSEILASQVKNNGSGDFNSVTKSQGFIELPKNKNEFLKGESYPLYLWKEF